MATLLLAACAPVPVHPDAGVPVRRAIVKVKAQTADVAAKVIAKVPEMRAEIQSLQTNVASTEVAFEKFDKEYRVAVAKVSTLEATVASLNETIRSISGARNFWRGVALAGGAALLVCLAILIIPKIPV